MRKRTPPGFRPALVFAAGLTIASSASAQLRVVTMNGANSTAADEDPRTPWMQTILSSIGSIVSDDPTIAGNSGIAKPIDVLALQEVHSAATTSAAYANLLNTIYPGANYQYATLDGASTGSGTQGLVYNANAVSLEGQVTIGTTSSTGMPRQALRYQLRPVGYGASADIYLYNSHYKSDTGSQDRRNDEAVVIRNNADALGPNKNIIYLGDLNVYDSTEPMYQTLLAAGNGKANDPINKPGAWTANSAFKAVHTQSPFNSATATSLGTGFSGTTGGMDDRFDQQLVSNSMVDGHGVAYIANSYSAFGNNNTAAWGSGGNPINVSSNNFPGTTAAQRNGPLLDALAGVLDHLPVVADYTIPAKMTAGVTGGIPAQVITGGSVSVTLNVANSAPVSFASGADSLSYTYSSTGAATGSGSGTAAALATGNNHTITLSTAGTGAKSGSVSVTSSSESVVNGTFTQPVNYTVLDHADASFSTLSSVTAQTVDFGYVPINSATRTSPFTIANRSATNRAGLDLDTITNTGDTARLTTNAATFSNLAAGSNNNYNASLNASVAGNFSATHTFAMSDQNLPGAAARPNLVLTTTARVFSVANFPVTGFMFLPASEPLTTGSFSIGAGVTLTKTGPGAMTINGPHSNGAGSKLLMSGGSATFNSDAGPTSATLNLAAQTGTAVTFNATQHLASLDAQGATITVTSGGDKVLSTPTLTMDSLSTLNLTDEDLVINYTGTSPLGSITSLVRSGFHNGDWLGKGITSTVASNPLSNGNYALGIAENKDLVNPFGNGSTTGPLFSGQSVDLTTVLVKFTHRIDLDLDGLVTGNDAAIFNGAFSEGDGGATWQTGDVDYDGVYSSNDAAIFNSFYDEGLASLPEPGVAGLAVIGLITSAAARCTKRGRPGTSRTAR